MNKDHLRDAEQYLLDASRTEHDGFADRLMRKAVVSALVAIAQELKKIRQSLGPTPPFVGE